MMTKCQRSGDEFLQRLLYNAAGGTFLERSKTPHLLFSLGPAISFMSDKILICGVFQVCAESQVALSQTIMVHQKGPILDTNHS